MLNWSSDGARRQRRSLFLPEPRMVFLELQHLPIGSPTQVTVAGVLQIHTCNLLETTRLVEARRKLIGERLILDKAVFAGRTDCLFVEAHSLSVATFEAGDLRPNQRGAVLEILRTTVRPHLQCVVMTPDGLLVLRSLIGRADVVE